MHATLCICELVPQLRTRTKLTLVVHYREARKPTNTGQLAARCLVDSAIEIFGERDPRRTDGMPVRREARIGITLRRGSHLGESGLPQLGGPARQESPARSMFGTD